MRQGREKDEERTRQGRRKDRKRTLKREGQCSTAWPIRYNINVNILWLLLFFLKHRKNFRIETGKASRRAAYILMTL